MIRKILRSGDPKLREISKTVVKIDSKILKLVQDLKETLAVQKDPEGVGLAAPQIGKNLRIFVANYKELNKVIINPEIIETHQSPITNHQSPKSRREILEGCLSLPNYYGPLKRVNSIKIKYLNEEGKEMMEEFKSFNAQIVLHEIDHLNGVLFLDRLLEQKQPLYKLEADKWEEVEL
ncbi:MAG: peptide deformylase [Candidatus Woesebacteria bacterium]|nr:peptide deformylase [Candidatus Woesebacteria bacterium]